MARVILVGVLVLPALLGSAVAVLDCCALGFGTTRLTNGNDSSVCVRDTEDCCSPFYLNNHLKDTVVEPQLNEYLMREFTDGIDNTLPQVQQLIEYFDDHSFERDMVHVLGTSTSPNVNESENSIITLTETLSGGKREMDHACATVGTKLSSLVVNITEAHFGMGVTSEAARQCINRTVSDKMQRESLAMVSSGLVELYSSTLHAVKKILSFIQSQRNRTEGSGVSSACVDGYIEAAFCRQCVERTPPLCLLTCNALVRGCYSPYYTVLNGQFEQLWTEIEGLATGINSTVNNILTHTSKLVDFPRLISDIENDCGLMSMGDLGSSEEKRAVGIPSAVLEPLMGMTGPFQYGEGDLKICRVKIDESACNEVTQGPQIQDCTPNNMTQLKSGEYTANPGNLSISECDCFDGVDFVSDGDTTRTFDGNDIHDQGNNPAFQPPLDVAELERERDQIEQQQGNPVEKFLESKDYTKLKVSQGSVCSSGGEEEEEKEEEEEEEKEVDPINTPTTETGSAMLASITVLFASVLAAHSLS